LKISKNMLTLALTHHQVMPSFLDFVFPFGMQENEDDFYFSGFREETNLISPRTGLIVPELGRSGREIRICYNLKSVEPLKGNLEWPWEICQAAVYHSFDIETGNSFWVFVKGNKLMKRRIESASAKDCRDFPSLRAFESISRAFASALAAQLILCDWCNQEWQWYLNYLEKQSHNATRQSLVILFDKDPRLVIHNHPQVAPSTGASIVTRKTPSGRPREQDTTLPPEPPGQVHGQAPLKLNAQPDPRPLPPPPPVLPPGMHGIGPERGDRVDDDVEFSFGKLQIIQHLEEKASSIPPILEANIDILSELKGHYQSILNFEDCPEKLRSDCRRDFVHFEKRIQNIVSDLHRQCSRTQNLQRLLSERKNLVRHRIHI
jgi:hypothetical protein